MWPKQIDLKIGAQDLFNGFGFRRGLYYQKVLGHNAILFLRPSLFNNNFPAKWMPERLQ